MIPSNQKNPRTSCDYTLRDFYKFFTHKYEHKRGSKTPLKIYADVIEEFNTYIIDDIIHGNVFYMPAGLGSIGVTKQKTSAYFDLKRNKLRAFGLSVDFKKTVELWQRDEIAYKNRKRIIHANDHTDNKQVRFIWSKIGCNIHTKNYKFRVVRTGARALAKHLKETQDVNIYPDYVYRKIH